MYRLNEPSFSMRKNINHLHHLTVGKFSGIAIKQGLHITNADLPPRVPFYSHGLILISIPAWISKHMASKMWDEITSQFPNFNGFTVKAWERIRNIISHIIMGVITYPCWDLSLSMLVNWAPIANTSYTANPSANLKIHNLISMHLGGSQLRRHQIETFAALLAFWWPVNSPHKG